MKGWKLLKLIFLLKNYFENFFIIKIMKKTNCENSNVENLLVVTENNYLIVILLF